MPTGRLKIEVFTAEEGKPLPISTVLVKDKDGKLIEELETDINGHTQTISLPAPDLKYSETPDTSERPYSLYDITVKNKDYDNIMVKNVQVLPDSTAIQGVDLSSFIKQGPMDNIIITDNTLYGDYPPKIVEPEIKDVNNDTGYVVLDKVVIPETVIVHMGNPQNAAKDYWIPFTSYIKNVACSEIYSTWPRETIKANVHAIISFTLNRVYTEWYRNKGYNFTITNQTAYDQYFVYGRTIYAEISQIVDEIFTSYITKTGIVQPILTQYCDGKTTLCPKGMSQWGSKALGDKGYGSLSILQNYYGSDVYLKTAAKVIGVPKSYQRLLQIGSVGPDVKTMQSQLAEINKNYPGIPAPVADGIFGEKTRQSVVKFQQVFNLIPDGLVGPATWYKISYIYVAVKKLNG